MSHFKAKASELFPKAVWTGGSAIHASIARQGVIPLDFNKPRIIVASLEKFHFGNYVQRVIMKMVPDLEWLLTQDEFQDLLHLDYYRMLKGMGSLATKQKLKNPSTGNVFHRVALLEDHKIVGGVRVWISDAGNGQTNIGWRFRLEEQVQESGKVRAKARILAESFVEESVELKEYVAQETSEKVLALEEFVPA